MKLEINLSQLEPLSIKDKSFSVRVPLEHFEKLKKYNPNISHTIRVLISEFLQQAEREKKEWTRK